MSAIGVVLHKIWFIIVPLSGIDVLSFKSHVRVYLSLILLLLICVTPTVSQVPGLSIWYTELLYRLVLLSRIVWKHR